MRTAKWLITTNALIVALYAASTPAQADPQPVASGLLDPPKLGQPIQPQQIRSITIWPDGRGLPTGSGNAVAGREVYTRQCQSCHGQAGVNGINDALVGGQVAPTKVPKTRTVGSYWPYATSLFDYVRRAMPYRQPGSLSNDETYAVVAYLLFLNEVIAEDLMLDAQQLSKVSLPNRARFYSEYELP